eukprot:TRINITY_DN16007_c0_g1_i1.p1 TRINITY_DN16007_c0_g1~~TRINITY_DN16007_c0_g1_i1.p1  ORF type:complete len:259 (+),score=67.57 TRINITY_DN16007_c0_g1_i1:54-779(+)
MPAFQILLNDVVERFEIEVTADPERESNWSQWCPCQSGSHLRTWQWNGVIGEESPFEEPEPQLLEKPEFYSLDCDVESEDDECLDEETITINFAQSDIATPDLPVFYSYDFDDDEEENELYNKSVDSYPEYYCLDCESEVSDELAQTRIEFYSYDCDSSIDDTEITELRIEDMDSCFGEEEVTQFRLEQFASPKSLPEFYSYDVEEDSSSDEEWLPTAVEHKYNLREYAPVSSFSMEQNVW